MNNTQKENEPAKQVRTKGGERTGKVTGRDNCATCFAPLQQKELKSVVTRFTTNSLRSKRFRMVLAAREMKRSSFFAPK